MRRSRLSQYKQNKLIELFIAGVTARTAAQLVGVNKNTEKHCCLLFSSFTLTDFP